MLKFKRFHTIIVGSGAAGLNCALHINRNGIPSSEIAIVTEKLGGGTSFDAGSDKQTYYKLSMIGNISDSPEAMAKSLFDGGSMHGDIALIEASCSIPCFMHLVQIGVPFPHDQFGGYVGYKTDNDPVQRGTSVGPLTSHKMGECLLLEVQAKKIPIFDHQYALKILKTPTDHACGILTYCLDHISEKEKEDSNDISKYFQIFIAENVILATGGPAGIYADSVYPISQWGSTSLAIEAGAVLQNLTESQYGLASLKFRWNVSGSYQQVIPRYVSLPEEEDPAHPKSEPKEFLQEYFPDIQSLATAIFLKGYQWPFNPERIEKGGSSLIDLAVHEERWQRHRKVFLDYQNNLQGFDIHTFKGEGKDYLHKSSALQNTPFDRLQQLNPKAIKLYRDHGINVDSELLEIGVCAQHCNGGIQGDLWWQTSIQGLFAIGEANGSHGVHRPGGSALNAGQVGGLRVAERIAYGPKNDIGTEQSIGEILINTCQWIEHKYSKLISQAPTRKKCHPAEILKYLQKNMSQYAAHIRNVDKIRELARYTEDLLNSFFERITLPAVQFLEAWKLWEATLIQYAFFHSIIAYSTRQGGSRGSYLIQTQPANSSSILPQPHLSKYSFVPRNYSLDDQIQTIRVRFDDPFALKGITNITESMVRRSIPKTDAWFETVWKKFEDKEIF